MERHHILARHLVLTVEFAVAKEWYSLRLHLLAGTGQMSATPESDVSVSLYKDLTETAFVRCLATTKSLSQGEGIIVQYLSCDYMSRSMLLQSSEAFICMALKRVFFQLDNMSCC